MNLGHRAPPPEPGVVTKSQAAAADGAAAASRGAVADSGYVAPCNRASNTQLGYFSWLELPRENEGRFVRFGHARTGAR